MKKQTLIHLFGLLTGLSLLMGACSKSEIENAGPDTRAKIPIEGIPLFPYETITIEQLPSSPSQPGVYKFRANYSDPNATVKFTIIPLTIHTCFEYVDCELTGGSGNYVEYTFYMRGEYALQAQVIKKPDINTEYRFTVTTTADASQPTEPVEPLVPIKPDPNKPDPDNPNPNIDGSENIPNIEDEYKENDPEGENLTHDDGQLGPYDDWGEIPGPAPGWK